MYVGCRWVDTPAKTVVVAPYAGATIDTVVFHGLAEPGPGSAA